MESNSTDDTVRTWFYQCSRCFTKHRIGCYGTHSDAVANAPTCCSGEPMTPRITDMGSTYNPAHPE